MSVVKAGNTVHLQESVSKDHIYSFTDEDAASTLVTKNSTSPQPNLSHKLHDSSDENYFFVSDTAGSSWWFEEGGVLKSTTIAPSTVEDASQYMFQFVKHTVTSGTLKYKIYSKSVFDASGSPYLDTDLSIDKAVGAAGLYIVTLVSAPVVTPTPADPVPVPPVTTSTVWGSVILWIFYVIVIVAALLMVGARFWSRRQKAADAAALGGGPLEVPAN